MFRLFLFIFTPWWMSYSYGSLSCDATQFDQFEKNCIEQFQDKLQPQSFYLSDLRPGYVYFYKTDLGHYGKLIVHGHSETKRECTLYYSFHTFQKGADYSGSTTRTISNQMGQWTNSEINLDGIGNNYDLALKNDKGKCYLGTTTASIHFYGNIDKTGVLTRHWLLFAGAMVLLGLAAFYISFSIFREESQYKVTESLDDFSQSDDQSKRTKKLGLIHRVSKPFYRRYFLSVVSGMKNNRKIKRDYKRKIANAGLTQLLSTDEFFAWKLLLIILFPIAYLGFRFLLDADWPLLLTPVLSVVGFYYPDIWIKSTIDKRREDIEVQMPFVVDMLALSVEAGLDFIAAMTRVIEKAPPGPLTEEFQLLLSENRLGASRAEALRQLSWRVNTTTMASFTATLIAADSVGASVGPILKELSAGIRQKKSSEVEKKAAQAATKLIFIMIFTILPAVVVLVFGSFIIDFLR